MPWSRSDSALTLFTYRGSRGSRTNFIEALALVLTVGSLAVAVTHFAVDAWYRVRRSAVRGAEGGVHGESDTQSMFKKTIVFLKYPDRKNLKAFVIKIIKK